MWAPACGSCLVKYVWNIMQSSGAVQELGTQGATQILLRLQVVPSISEVMFGCNPRG